MKNFNEHELSTLYSKKKFQYIIDNISNNLFQKKINEKEKVFKINLVACCYVNLGMINEAVEIYKIAKKKIQNFDGPEVKYNIGIIPEDLKSTDKKIEKFLSKKLKGKISKKNLTKIANSLKINPKIKGHYHSNLGLSLINLIEILKIKRKKKIEKIYYLNPKYNSYRAEILLKQKKIILFKKEIKKILKYNSINTRLFSLISYAIQKYKIKDVNYFCKNPFDYVKKFNLINEKKITLDLIKNVNYFISKQSKNDSYEPGSIFQGYKSVGNFFNSNNPEINKLNKIFIKKVKDYLKFYQNYKEPFIKKFPEKRIFKGWYIRLKKGGGIDYHIHNSWLSAVFYSKIPDKNDTGTLDLSLANWGFKKEKNFFSKISPRVGDLIFFPSSLPHRVSKFNKNKFRISIAFDVVPI